MHCLSPENVSIEIKANNEYQYEDNDIIRILELKLNELKESGLRLDVHQLAPISDHALEQFISDVKNFINQKKQLGQQIDKKTYLVIPYNLGIYHWTGLLIILDASFVAERIIYCDSLNGSANIPKDLLKRLIQLWPNLSASAIETKSFYLQSDNTSCGVLAIENLIGLLQVAGGQQIFNNSKKLSIEETQKIRKEHLKIIELKARDKYEYFYKYQRDNRPTVLSLQEQLAFHTKGVKFSPQEHLRIHNLCKVYKELSSPLVKEVLLNSLRYAADQNIEVKIYLNKIRAELKALWQMHLISEDRDRLFQIIKMIIRIDDDESNLRLELIDNDFWPSHEELKKCYDLLSNNSDMINKETLSKNIHLIEKQIKDDEILAKKLQEQELANYPKFIKNFNNSSTSFDFKQQKNTYNAKQLLNSEFTQRPISHSIIKDNLHNEAYCLFPEVFEAIATSHKDNISIIDENNSKNGKTKFTYEELSYRVNQLANFLKKRVPVNYEKGKNNSTGNEASSLREDEIPVGVFLPASAEAVIAILAIWKARLVYVPLGVRKDRFGRTVRAITQTKPKLIISNQSYIDVFKTSVTEYTEKDKSTKDESLEEKLNTELLFDINDISKSNEHDKSHELQSILLSCINETDRNRAAYIFPSSGSTGNPKDIIIEHCGLWYPMYSISHMRYKNGTLDLTMTDNDVVGQFAELTFDASILEIMMTLGMGAKLVIIPEEIRTDAKKLSNFFNTHKINICTFTPTMLTNLEPNDFPKFKFIISTGEKLPRTVFDKWTKAGIPIINGYGPSEVSIATSLGLCTTDDIHIGQPIANLQIHVLGKKYDSNDKNRIQDKEILDDNDKQILVENKLINNEEGELYIQSPGLARGYLNNPDLTNKRFMWLALDGSGKPPIRVYRTRDAGKYNNGNYYTTGRLDRQTKIYGQLLNPEDIDEIINKDEENIKAAYTCIEINIDEIGQEHPVITAYILLKPGSKLQNQIADKQREIVDTNGKIEMFAELKSCFIKARKRLSNTQYGLPYYQIPSRWSIISVPAFNPNQKIETSKLNEKAITKPCLLHTDGVPIILSDRSIPQSIEIKLANKWREILNLDKKEPIYPEDNFLWLGGTSIRYLQLQRWLETEYPGIHLPSFLAFYEKGTFQQMAMWIHLHTNEKIELITPLRNNILEKDKENKFPLILIHALWGNAQRDYSAFEAPPHKGRDIYLISAPGLKKPYLICGDIHTLAGCYARAIRAKFGDSGYIIAGWSTGGAIANAVTNILHKDGHGVAGIILDTLLPKSQLAKDQCIAIIEHFKDTAKNLEWNKNPAINLDEDSEFKEAFKINNNPLKLIDELFKLLQAKRASVLVDKKAPEIKTVHSLMIALHRYKPVKSGGLVCLLKTEDTCLQFGKDSNLGWKTVNLRQIPSLLPGDHHGIKNTNSKRWFDILLETTNALEAEISLRDIQSELKKAYLSRYKDHQYDYRVQITGGSISNSFQDLFQDKKNDVINTFILSAENGMGKTATLKAIAHSWAEDKLPCFKVVIFVDINNFIKKENVTVEDFFIEQLQSDISLDQEKVLTKKYFRNVQKYNILLLIDDFQTLINNPSEDAKKLKKLTKECLGKNYDILFCVTPDVQSKVLQKIKKSNQRKSNTRLLFLTPLQDKHIENAIKIREEYTILNSASFIEYLIFHPDVKEKTRNPKVLKDSINRYIEEHDKKILLSEVKSKTSAFYSKSVQSSSETKSESSPEFRLSSIYSSDEFTTIKHYVKREALTQMMGLIQPSFFLSQSPLIQVCFITGITGSGKSELARAYGVYYKEQCQKLHQRHCIFWINAEKPQEWISSIHKFSSKTGCQINQSSQDLSVLIVDFVKALQQYPEFVLVIDNLEDSTHKYLMQFLQELKGYQDKKLIIKGTILVTTQKHTISNTSWPINNVHSITLNSGMTREEAVCLMSQFLNLDEVQLKANRIYLEHFLNELGYLPLTISTVAAYLLQGISYENDLNNNLKSYLDNYFTKLKLINKKTIALLEESWSNVNKKVLHKHEANQIGALLLSIGNLNSNHIEAFELLALLSFLESRTLTRSAIEKYAQIIFQDTDKFTLNVIISNALQRGMNFSLITQVSEDKKSNYHLHPQTMLICRYICEYQYSEKEVFYQKLNDILVFLLELIKEENINSNKEDKFSIENSLEYLDHASYLNEHLLRLNQITEIEYKDRKDKLFKAEKILSNRVYYEAGDEEEAIKRYNHILSINPEDIDTLQDRANCYRFIQKYDLAFQDLKKLKALAKGNLRIEYQYIRVLVASGKREEAERKFEKIQKQDTGKEYIRERLTAYEALGRSEEVLAMIDSYDEAIQKKCLETKTICLENMGRYDEAITLCRKAINEKIEITPYIFYRLAFIQKKKGDYAKAFDDYKTAILKHKIGTHLWLLMVDDLSKIDVKHYSDNILNPREWISFVDNRITESHFPAYYWLLQVSYYCKITEGLLQRKDKVDKVNYDNIISGLIKLNSFKDILKNVNIISIIDSVRYVIAGDLDNKNYERAYQIANLVYEIEISSKVISLLSAAVSGIKNYPLAFEYFLQWLILDKEDFINYFDCSEFFQVINFYDEKEMELTERLARENQIEQLYFYTSAAFIMQKYKSSINTLILTRLIKFMKEHLSKSLMKTLWNTLNNIIIFYLNNKNYTEALSLITICNKFNSFAEIYEYLSAATAGLKQYDDALKHFIEWCMLDKERFIKECNYQGGLFNTIQFINNVEILLQLISQLKHEEKLCFLVSVIHSKTSNKGTPEDKLFIALKDNIEQSFSESSFKLLWAKLRSIIIFYLNNENYTEALCLINICKQFNTSAEIYKYLSAATAGLNQFDDALNHFMNWCVLDKEMFIKECNYLDSLFITIQLTNDAEVSLQSVSRLEYEEKLCFLVAVIHSKTNNRYAPEEKLFIALKEGLEQNVTESLIKLLWDKLTFIIIFYLNNKNYTEALSLINICKQFNTSAEIYEYLSAATAGLNQFDDALNHFIDWCVLDKERFIKECNYQGSLFNTIQFINDAEVLLQSISRLKYEEKFCFLIAMIYTKTSNRYIPKDKLFIALKYALEQYLEEPLFIKHYGDNHSNMTLYIMNLGLIYLQLGNFIKAKGLLEQSLPLLKEHYGDNHPYVGLNIMNLGTSYLNLGNFVRAKVLLEQSLPLLKHYGENHSNLALNIMNLGAVYLNLGNFIKAKELLEQSLSKLKEHYGENDSNTALNIMNLGVVYLNLGNFIKAKELLEQSLPLLKEHYGDNHSNVALNINNLGMVYLNHGDFKKAKELFEQSLYLLKEYYGDDHSHIAVNIMNLGSVHSKLGNFIVAKELLEQSLSLLKEHYGDNHSNVALNIMNLGMVYLELGNFIVAKELLEQSLYLLNANYGNDHSNVAQNMMNLGMVYLNLGNYIKAKELLEQSLYLLKAKYGDNHPNVTLNIMNLGMAYLNLGNFIRAKELLEQSFPLIKAHYGNKHSTAAVNIMNLGLVNFSFGNYIKAKELLEQSLPLLKENYGDNHSTVAQNIMNLGATYLNLENFIKAKELLEQSISLFKGQYGDKHLNVAVNIMNLGSVYLNLGNFIRAKELLEQSLPLLKEHYGDKHSNVAVNIMNLGIVYLNLGGHIKAKELLELSLPLLEQFYGAKHPLVAKANIGLGGAYITLGNFTKAIGVLETSFLILNEHYDVEHPLIGKVTMLLNLARSNDLSIEDNDIERIVTKLAMPERQINLRREDLQDWLRLAYYHYNHANLEEAIRCCANVTILSPENANAHHNLACLYHVQNNKGLAEQHFKYALNIKTCSPTHGDYGFFLLRQKQYEEAIKNFVIAISLSTDDDELTYSGLEKNLLDKYLQQEVTAKSDLTIKPFFIAHYWLIQCFHLLKDFELRQFYLSRLVNIVQQLPLPLHNRILSYAYLLVANQEAADECMALAISMEEMKIEQEQLANFDFNQNHLNELIQIVEKSPTILRYRVLSYVYLSIDNEKAQEYDAMALSLEPTVEPLAKEKISQNTPEVTRGYNPSLFAKSDADTLNIKQLIGNKGTALRLLLHAAKISVLSNQKNNLVKIVFNNQKLVQQFTEELQKIGINNQSMEEVSRKSQGTIEKEDKGDESIIVLTADDYNIIMEEKDTCEKLTSQVENKNFALPVLSQNDQLNIARSASPKKYPTISSSSFWQPVKEINREPLHNLEKVKTWLKDILPKDVNLGSAISKGDCFFDAIAQGLNQKENKEDYDVKSLRLLCDEYAKDQKNNWVELANKRDREDHNSYLTRIQFTSEEMEENEKQGLKLGIAVWGRPKIEGRVVCEKFKIKLHVIEIQESGEVNRFLVDDKGENEDVNPVINYNEENLIHIVNYRNHYVPLIMSKILDKRIGLQK